MSVLIVARTNMTARVCVGAVDNNGTSLRLMTDGGMNQPVDCDYQIGDIWAVRIAPSPQLSPPHVEDVIAVPQDRQGRCEDLASELRKMHAAGAITNWWKGPVSALFEGRTRTTRTNFSRYVSPDADLPTCSVGFWEPHADLVLEDDQDRPAYRFETPGEFARLPYIGQTDPLPVIPKHTLVRVSLSRRWAAVNAGPERFWVQLSGWYLAAS